MLVSPVLSPALAPNLVHSASASEPPTRLEEPALPAELAGKGTVYHTISGRQAQVTFTSDAPLQDIVGKSNAVVGYAVAGPVGAPAALAGGRWLLPVASLATGIPLRDEHLAGDHWLDAGKHAAIEFALEKVEDIAQVKAGADFTTWTATLVGTMELHGVKKAFRVEKAKLSFLSASERTAKIAPGDLLFIQCAYEVKLSDFGVTNGDIPGKVADEIKLDQMLRLSTVAVEPGKESVDAAAGENSKPASAPSTTEK
jgi:polyisoprenoid-binding protein YceI